MKNQPPEGLINEVFNKKEIWRNYSEYLRNIDWVKENFETIKDEHRGEVVVILDKKVKFSDDNIEKVREDIRSLNPEQLNQSYIRYIPKEEELLLL
nr:hypothetical protein BSM_02750 [uncultured archaeon]